MTGRKMLGARIPPNLKRLVDADPRDNQDVVEAALWDEFGGQRKSAIEKRIEHKDRRIMQIQQELNDLEEELETVQHEKESLQQQLSKMEAATDAYEAALDEVLTAKESGDRGGRLIPETLEDIANEHGKRPEDVHEDLKQRAVDQERQLRTVEFISPMEEDTVTGGWVADVWGGDDDE